MVTEKGAWVLTVLSVLLVVLVVILALVLLALRVTPPSSPIGRTSSARGGALEIERVYFDFDEAQVKSKLAALGGQHKGKFLFRHVRFEPPRSDTHVVRARVRDEGHRTTMTVKRRFGAMFPFGEHGGPGGAPSPGEKYDTEDEVIINDFDKGVGLMGALGARKMYYLEKMRDIHKVRGPVSGGEAEIVFDTYPGLPPCLEIEAPTEADVLGLAAALGLRPDEDQARDAGDMYLEHYGITKDRPLTDLTFEGARVFFGPLVTKNREGFEELTGRHLIETKALR
jgi:adenylate cyclase class 2